MAGLNFFKMNKERVVVAMSGGVDSSVAAALLKSDGYEVIGITMCFSITDSAKKKPSCCGREGIEDARRVAHKLNIRHYVLNMQKPLKKYVIDNFLQEYSNGRTPNPCILCNQYLKFGLLLEKARSLGAKYLATGHYARIDRGLLKKGRDRKKDQSYFLYRLGQEQLRHILFPLGDYTKEEVRGLARKFALSVAEKAASQEICFLPQDDYRSFVKAELKDKLKPGMIVDREGNILGQHRGVAFYTVGQREGLGIAKGYPLYITKIDPRSNRITVGSRKDAEVSKFSLQNLHFISKPAENKFVARVRIRYNHKEAPAGITVSGTRAVVCFGKPQFAVCAGQSAVFYNRNTVLGGGIIEKVREQR